MNVVTCYCSYTIICSYISRSGETTIIVYMLHCKGSGYSTSVLCPISVDDQHHCSWFYNDLVLIVPWWDKSNMVTICTPVCSHFHDLIKGEDFIIRIHKTGMACMATVAGYYKCLKWCRLACMNNNYSTPYCWKPAATGCGTPKDEWCMCLILVHLDLYMINWV